MCVLKKLILEKLIFYVLLILAWIMSSNILFKQFEDGLPIDVNKKYFIYKQYLYDYGLQEIHKLCLFPEKLRGYLANAKIDESIINTKTKYYNYTPLVMAISNDINESIKLLLEYGADVNFQNKYGYTPLMCGYWIDIKNIKLLLEYGDDVNTQNIYKETVLNMYDNLKRVKLFLQYQNTKHDSRYKKYILNTACNILINFDNKKMNISLNSNIRLQKNINNFKKLKSFDYYSIVLYEVKKCVF